jgi:hypothetical protein
MVAASVQGRNGMEWNAACGQTWDLSYVVKAIAKNVLVNRSQKQMATLL